MTRRGNKFYAVRIGRIPGVYETWEAANRQVEGFHGARHKSFASAREAYEWYGAGGIAVDVKLDMKPDIKPDLRAAPSTPPPVKSERKNEARAHVRAAAGTSHAPIDISSSPASGPPSSPDFQILSQQAGPSTPTRPKREYPSADSPEVKPDRKRLGLSAPTRPLTSPSRILQTLNAQQPYTPPNQVTNTHPYPQPVPHQAQYEPQQQPQHQLQYQPQHQLQYQPQHQLQQQPPVPVPAPPPPPPPPAAGDDEDATLVLSEQQSAALQRVVNGENIFFTGSAGTGKSVLLRAIIRRFRAPKHADFCLDNRRLNGVPLAYRYIAGECTECPGCNVNRDSKVLAVTASTGMAALNIGGCTLHSWAGVGLGDRKVEKLIGMVQSRESSTDRWQNTDILIIDEISMLKADFLDKLNLIGKAVRRDNRPFGGIQLVFCGDFFQLPPVVQNQDKKNGEVVFAFDADCWNHLFPRNNIVHLKSVFRQTDEGFVKTLENMRRGRLTERQDALLRSLDRPVDMADGIEPVRLFPLRYKVNQYNALRLAELEGEVKTYDAKDRTYPDRKGYFISLEKAKQKLNDRGSFPQHLHLAVGAQVMLVQNWKDTGLVNGSTGRVMGFANVAEASTQGAYVYTDTRDNREGSPPPAASTDRWPLVQFKEHRSHSHLPRLVLVPEMTLTLDNADGDPEASRTQIPLILAWAITIHKAQGLTLDKVHVDLGGTFDTGQAYVAISRARSLQGLELKGYRMDLVKTSHRVLEWAEELDQDAEWDELVTATRTP